MRGTGHRAPGIRHRRRDAAVSAITMQRVTRARHATRRGAPCHHAMNRIAIVVAFVCVGCREQPVAARASTAAPTAAKHRIRRSTLPPVLADPVTSASLWATAASSDTAQSWTAVADSLQRELAECTKDCLFLAHELVEARDHADRIVNDKGFTEHENGRLPPVTRALIEASDAYVSLASPSDPQVEHLQLMTALTLNYCDELAGIPRLQTFVSTYRDGDRSIVAKLLLDSLIRNGEADELERLVTQLLAGPTGLDADVQQRLASIQASLAIGKMPSPEE